MSASAGVPRLYRVFWRGWIDGEAGLLVAGVVETRTYEAVSHLPTLSPSSSNSLTVYLTLPDTLPHTLGAARRGQSCLYQQQYQGAAAS